MRYLLYGLRGGEMMLNDIKARCEQFVADHSYDLSVDGNGDPDETSVDYIESFYREAMAKGLEMAAEIYESSGDEIGLSEVFREQANKLKESPCDTSLG